MYEEDYGAIAMVAMILVVITVLIIIFWPHSRETGTLEMPAESTTEVEDQYAPQVIKEAIKVVETAIKVVEKAKTEKESQPIAKPPAVELSSIIQDEWELPELPALSDL